MAARLADDLEFSDLVAASVETAGSAPPKVDDLLSIKVAPPVSGEKVRATKEAPLTRVPVKSKINYLEREARNRSLGRAGEELVLQYEHERLWRAGRRTLADRIQHVSVTQGDGLGYDIESFEESGKPRLIEAKTTRFGSMTPFFASKNEVSVSNKRDHEYFLYRVYDFPERPKLFMLPGSLQVTCDLEPVEFRASVR